MPPVSVVMPVRNGLPYLHAAVESILGQSHADFELVVLDNGSTDGSADVLRDYAVADRRVRVLFDAVPGVVRSSQRALEAARFEVVARMDADDVAHPRRLERQVAALAANPAAVVVGTLWEGIDSTGRVVRPRDRWLVRRPLPHRVPFPHGTATFRRNAAIRAGGYRDGTQGWEDLDLYLRLARLGTILVLTEPLYRYRFHAVGASGRDVEREWATMARCLDEPSDDDPSDDEARAPLSAVRYRLARQVWAGSRPPLVPHLRSTGRRLRSAEGATMAALAFVAAIHPEMVRKPARAAVRLRDGMAGLAGVPTSGVHEVSFADQRRPEAVVHYGL